MPAERSPGPNKTRLDVLLVERGLADSRTKAQALIRAGDTMVDGERIDKPGALVKSTAHVQVRARLPYVSRGGQKLAAALDHFKLDVSGQTCLDVGASTGGFTDCLLQRGAPRVFAVDVGRAQLAWSLRTDPRVDNMERTDIRKVGSLPCEVSLATIDVAFISLRHVLPAVRELLREDALVVALVKPQFEAGREQVGRKGVISDANVHRQVLREVLGWAFSHGWALGGLIESPVTGASGNREFLALLGMHEAGVTSTDIDSMVRQAVPGTDQT